MFPFTLVCYSERYSLCFFMKLASRTNYFFPLLEWRTNSELKSNVCLILNTTFLIVARRSKKKHPSGLQFHVGSGTLQNLAAGPPTSKMGAWYQASQLWSCWDEGISVGKGLLIYPDQSSTPHYAPLAFEPAFCHGLGYRQCQQHHSPTRDVPVNALSIA